MFLKKIRKHFRVGVDIVDLVIVVFMMMAGVEEGNLG
jgi:hypothetical protein